MSDVVELKKNVKRLQAAVNEKNEEDILAIMNIMKTEFEINEQILRESKAGLAVGKLRQNESVKVANAAKELVKKWKTTVDKQKAGGKSAASTPTPKPSAINTNISASGSKGGAQTPSTPVGANGAPRTAKSDGFTGTTRDNVRDKCMELIYDALASDSPAPTELIARRAAEVENAVYANHGSAVTAEYRNKIRSLFVNLKDKNNPALRESIVSGEISAKSFAVMTSEDMASEEQKAKLKKIKEDNLFQSLSAKETEAETEAFQCSKCKQRKCRYRQAQTRSADEPMTTFVTCTVCGNRWKFS